MTTNQFCPRCQKTVPMTTRMERGVNQFGNMWQAQVTHCTECGMEAYRVNEPVWRRKQKPQRG